MSVWTTTWKLALINILIFSMMITQITLHYCSLFNNFNSGFYINVKWSMSMFICGSDLFIVFFSDIWSIITVFWFCVIQRVSVGKKRRRRSRAVFIVRCRSANNNSCCVGRQSSHGEGADGDSIRLLGRLAWLGKYPTVVRLTHFCG